MNDEILDNELSKIFLGDEEREKIDEVNRILRKN